MPSTVSVGRFATMTHLSVKTLRHYHQVGLLEPAEIDPYRVPVSRRLSPEGRLHAKTMNPPALPAAPRDQRRRRGTQLAMSVRATGPPLIARRRPRPLPNTGQGLPT
jgi:hypothetical protein